MHQEDLADARNSRIDESRRGWTPLESRYDPVTARQSNPINGNPSNPLSCLPKAQCHEGVGWLSLLLDSAFRCFETRPGDLTRPREAARAWFLATSMHSHSPSPRVNLRLIARFMGLRCAKSTISRMHKWRRSSRLSRTSVRYLRTSAIY